MNQTLLQIFETIIAICLIIVILLQNRGTSLGGVFGGGNAVYRTKRGMEKGLFIATIVLSVIFAGLFVINLFIK